MFKLARERASAITQELRQRVHSGVWKPRQRIHSEHQLAEQFGVSRGTVIRSLRQLEREGLVRSRRGSGRFVVDPAERRHASAIAFVVPDISRLDHPVTLACLEGIRQVCLEYKLHLELLGLNPLTQDRTLPEVLERLDSHRLGGAIVDSWLVPESRLIALSQRIAMVLLSRSLPHGRAAQVLIDLSGGTFDAAEHLIELGHARIVLVTVEKNRYQGWAQQEGVRLAMRYVLRQGRGTSDLVISTSNLSRDWEEEFNRALSKPQRPTAVIFGSDDLAENGLKFLDRLGLRVPDDISVISTNDMLHPPRVPIPLSSVRVDYRAAGREAARLLLAMIHEAPDPPPQRLVPAVLIVRQSTAAPPQLSQNQSILTS